jgi:hypothetical protein
VAHQKASAPATDSVNEGRVDLPGGAIDCADKSNIAKTQAIRAELIGPDTCADRSREVMHPCSPSAVPYSQGATTLPHRLRSTAAPRLRSIGESTKFAASPRLRSRIRPTPKTTIEAIMHSVRERGPSALKEPANRERLARCDDAALAEIDRRLLKLGSGK